MIVFLLCMLAIVITGGGIATNGYFGIAVIYMILGTLSVSYIYYFSTRREALFLGSAEKCLLVFEGWGLIQVLISLVGINQRFQADLGYNLSFLPRQAVYFFVLPAVILFQEDVYFKGIECFLKRYGEVLFWVLIFAQMFYFHEMKLMVMTEALLCWLSLWLNTKQRWRRWIRIIVLVVTPLFSDGQSTIILLRLLLCSIYIIPKRWFRVVVCLMAVFVLAVVCIIFVMPLTLDDQLFSDPNMSWRLRTWKDSETVLIKTNLAGVGYGTTYQSLTYANETRQRGEQQYTAGDGYTEEERVFVTAPHNSFISLAMRTGIIGISLFILFLSLLFWDLIKYKTMPSKAACFALFASVILILFNVGLENPGYLLTFTFLIGIVVREGKKMKDQHRMLQGN